MGGGRRGAVAKVALATSAAAVLLACDSGKSDVGGASRVDTLADGRVLISNADNGPKAQADALHLVEKVRIGTGAAGAGPDALGEVGSLTADMTGNVYLADSQIQAVLVFDAEGAFVRRLGRAGRGPGELMWAFGRIISVKLAWQPPDRLWVTDQPLLQLLDTAGSFIAAVPEVEMSGFGRFNQPAQVDTMGFAYYGVRLPGNLEPDFVVRYGISGSYAGHLVALDSLRLDQPTSVMRLSQPSGDRVSVQSITVLPMQPRVLWAIGPTGNVWLASTSEYRLHEVTLAGDTLRTIELAREPDRLGGAERDSLAEASGFDLSQIPVFRPLFDRLDVAPDGAVWVRTAPSEAAWDVFDACGRYLGNVSAETQRIREPFVVVAGGALFGVVADELDLEYVVQMQLSRADGSPVRPASEC